MRIEADVKRCQAYANCLSAAPDLFDLGENGLVEVLVEEPAPERMPAARKAEKLCPVAAISLKDD
jgi:ferredoxin